MIVVVHADGHVFLGFGYWRLEPDVGKGVAGRPLLRQHLCQPGDLLRALCQQLAQRFRSRRVQLRQGNGAVTVDDTDDGASGDRESG
jgi:hypothetical protein